MTSAVPFSSLGRQLLELTIKRLLRTRAILTVAVFIAAIIPCSSSMGQTSSWANPAGGLYSEPTNWSNGVPHQGGNAFFLLNTAYSVGVDINAVNLNTIFAASNSTINLDISASSYTTSLMKVGTGAGTNNHVSVSGGLLDAGTIEIAPSLGQGSLTVNGRIRSTYLVVGGQAFFPGFFAMTPGGQGTLTINNGAEVTVKGLLADNAGAGSRIVHNGGVLSIQGIGRFNTQTSPQSFTQVGDGVHVAVLNLQNNLLPNGSEIPGQYDFGNEALSIAARSVINFDSLGGSLTVGNIVRESSPGNIGAFNWVAGQINLTNSELRVGNNGQFGSSVNLAAGKLGLASLGTQIDAGSTLTLSGGSLETSTINSFGNFNFESGLLSVTDGDLRIGSGGITNPGGVNIDNDGSISTSGLLTIDTGRTVNLSGGSLTVDRIGGAGNLNFESGHLSIVNGDITAGSSGQLNSPSDIQIGANSSIQLQNGRFTLQSDRSLAVAGGFLSVNHLETNGSIVVESGPSFVGQIFANRIFHNGTGATAQLTVLDVDGDGDGGGVAMVASSGMERNNLIVDGGLVQVNLDGQTFDPVIDGSLVGGYTGDSSMLLNRGSVITPTMKIGVAEGFVDTVAINGGFLITENLISNGGARSILNFNGGTISTGHSEVDGPSTFVVGNGTTDALLILSGAGTHTFADGIELSASGRISGEGTIIGNIVNAGRISPGSSPGVLSIEGDLLNQGLIELEIESLTEFDEIFTTGTFESGGVISISLVGYEPNLAETFDLLDFGSFLDTGYVFDFSNAALNPGLTWDTTMFEIDGSIGVSAVPEPGPVILITMGCIVFAVVRRRV